MMMISEKETTSVVWKDEKPGCLLTINVSNVFEEQDTSDRNIKETYELSFQIQSLLGKPCTFTINPERNIGFVPLLIRLFVRKGLIDKDLIDRICEEESNCSLYKCN